MTPAQARLYASNDGLENLRHHIQGSVIVVTGTLDGEEAARRYSHTQIKCRDCWDAASDLANLLRRVSKGRASVITWRGEKRFLESVHRKEGHGGDIYEPVIPESLR